MINFNWEIKGPFYTISNYQNQKTFQTKSFSYLSVLNTIKRVVARNIPVICSCTVYYYSIWYSYSGTLFSRVYQFVICFQSTVETREGDVCVLPWVCPTVSHRDGLQSRLWYLTVEENRERAIPFLFKRFFIQEQSCSLHYITNSLLPWGKWQSVSIYGGETNIWHKVQSYLEYLHYTK